MKNIYRSIYIALLLSFSFFAQYSLAQGLIVNEISNGLTGAREYIEYVVVGSSATPLAPVNLTNWILDDNNGSFEAVGVGTGITSGHIVITGTCFSAMPPGAIIVLYNASDRNPAIPADDPTDSNGDNVYILSTANACFSVCNTNPNTSSGSYLPCTGGLVAATGASWAASLSLGNGGDAVQTRRPDGTFFHGFSYGDVTAPFPNFPSGTSSFNVGAGGGASYFYFECGGYESATNYNAAILPAGAGQTPGAANTANNQIFLNEVRAGSYNYSDLTNSANCDNILPVEFWLVKAQLVQGDIEVFWATASETDNSHFIVERSQTATQFGSILNPIKGQKNSSSKHFYRVLDTDVLPGIVYYYRIKQVDLDGDITYSKVVTATRHTPSHGIVATVQKNASNLKLQISFDEDSEAMRFLLCNTLGQVLVQEDLYPTTDSFFREWPINFPEGIYFYRLESLKSEAKWQGKIII